MNAKRKRTVVSLKTKLEAMRRLDEGETIKTVANHLGVGEVTVGDWRRNRAEIEKWCSQNSFERNEPNDRKTMKKCEFEKTSEALFMWFSHLRNKGSVVSGPMLQAKAREFHGLFKDGDNVFTASVGWLDRWKKRHGIRQLNINGDTLSANNRIVNAASFRNEVKIVIKKDELTDNMIVEAVKQKHENNGDNDSELCVEQSDKISHTDVMKALKLALQYIEQQPEATPADLLQLRRWQNMAAAKLVQLSQMSVNMDTTCGDYQDHIRSQGNLSIQAVTAGLANMKQELEMTHVNQTGMCIKNEVPELSVKVEPNLDFEKTIKTESRIPFLADLIKLEQKSEMFYGEISREDLDTKINQVDSLDRNIAGSKEVTLTRSCRENGDHSSCAQFLSHTDNWQQDEKSLYRTTQHEVFSKRLSEHKINSLTIGVNKNGDVRCVASAEAGEEYTPLRLTENEVSVDIKDCQKVSVDMNISQSSDNVRLPDVEGSRLSKHESCVSEKSNIDNDTGSTNSENEYSHRENHNNYDGCVISYVKKDSQQKHMIEKPDKSDICIIGCSQGSYLKVHAGQKLYICDVCGLRCYQGYNLKRHNLVHTGQKPHICDVCGVGFTQKGSLMKHMIIHTGQKPYRCDVCSVGFSQKSSLMRHKVIHTNTRQKPFKCDVCGVRFSKRSHLNRHEKVHQEERPYKCDACGVGFSKSNILNSHRKVHTGDTSYMCDLCGFKCCEKRSINKHIRAHN